jgi:hypothetical protein
MKCTPVACEKLAGQNDAVMLEKINRKKKGEGKKLLSRGVFFFDKSPSLKISKRRGRQ